MAANTGFNAPCEPSRWKAKGLLTGFTDLLPLGKPACGRQGRVGGIKEIED
jgi:hypothetical protein